MISNQQLVSWADVYSYSELWQYQVATAIILTIGNDTKVGESWSKVTSVSVSGSTEILVDCDGGEYCVTSNTEAA